MRHSLVLTLCALASLSFQARANATTIYGALSNFDCINDTGSTAHGFEIELDHCLPTDVYSTFGAPYNRYGTPTLTTDGVNTFVRYESSYANGAWTVGTDSGTYAPTGGHSLYFPQYGGAAAYPNVPGDHFGVALSVTPTNTVYHWLLDGGGGTLVQAGTSVKVPAPVLSLAPPANPVNPVAVQAVVQAPPAENQAQFGEAIWVKVFTTVTEQQNPVDLNELVVGNGVVPPDTETEVEWQLLQTDPQNPAAGEKVDQADVGAAGESVVRRYEFYTYTGSYDLENHQALNETYAAQYVGDYLGNQNVAVDLAPVGVPEPGAAVLAGLASFAGAILLMGRRRKRSPTSKA